MRSIPLFLGSCILALVNAQAQQIAFPSCADSCYETYGNCPTNQQGCFCSGSQATNFAACVTSTTNCDYTGQYDFGYWVETECLATGQNFEGFNGETAGTGTGSGTGSVNSIDSAFQSVLQASTAFEHATAAAVTGLPTATSVERATGTSQPSAVAAPSSGLSTGAKAGIGVGAALGALLVIGLIVFLIFFLRRRSRQNAGAPQQNMNAQAPPMAQQQYPQYQQPQPQPQQQYQTDYKQYPQQQQQQYPQQQQQQQNLQPQQAFATPYTANGQKPSSTVGSTPASPGVVTSTNGSNDDRNSTFTSNTFNTHGASQYANAPGSNAGDNPWNRTTSPSNELHATHNIPSPYGSELAGSIVPMDKPAEHTDPKYPAA